LERPFKFGEVIWEGPLGPYIGSRARLHRPEEVMGGLA